jgi:hypothetical protein
MKPDKETFEAIIADLEETREAFEAPAPLEERDRISPYHRGFNAGFEAAINQIKRKKRLLTGGDAASEETS